MATLPPEMILPESPSGARPRRSHDALALAWDALHGQAAQLALLARIAPEPEATCEGLMAALARADARRHAHALQAVEDISAMLASGLEALATLSRRGQDTAAPALTLWREFHAARSAVLAMAGAGTTA